MFKYEGDIQELADRQIDFINDVLQKKGFNNGTVLVEPVGKAGDNYMATVKRIILNQDGKTFKMIAKVSPAIEQLRKATFTELAFTNETVMYEEVLPKFDELQKSADVPKEDQFRFAECYGCLTESPHEMILLEDLQVSNFIMLNRFQSLTNEAVRLVLKDFAAYHSLSYILKKENPETYEIWKTKLVNMWHDTVKEMAMYFEMVENDTIALLEKDEHKKSVQGKVIKVIEIARENYDLELDSKYSVVQQGDAWTNNIMFRFEEGTPVESVMIDYQLSKVSNPAADLHYMIFNCTDYETRKKHYYDWLDYYHTQVDKYLSYFGQNANSVYPRDQLDADMKRYGKQGFVFAILLVGVLLRKSEDAAKFKTAMEKTDNLNDVVNDFSTAHLDDESKGKFKDRIIGLIESYTEYGYLKVD